MEFTDSDTRELILSYARSLAHYIDNENKPTAGIRMQVSDYLEGTYKLLENHGFQIKAQHGMGTRRIIKFDLIEKSLMLFYKLPFEEEWYRVTPDMAHAKRNRDNQRNLRHFESTLSPPNAQSRWKSGPQSASRGNLPPAQPLQRSHMSPTRVRRLGKPPACKVSAHRGHLDTGHNRPGMTAEPTTQMTTNFQTSQ